MKIRYKKVLRKIAARLGYKIVPTGSVEVPEVQKTDPAFVRLLEKYRAYTMTSPERMYALYQAVHYVLKANIPGDIVECGVWRGGSSMIIADILREAGSTRKVFLYDTFGGMSAPTDQDVETLSSRSASLRWKTIEENNHNDWCNVSLEEVRKNMESVGYDMGNVVFVKGKVEETIPATLPSAIALLRLDTDWYESTYHEFVYLFPLLSKNGALLVDDYGHWSGAREATDGYFKEKGINMLLSRIDYTGRIGIKT